MTMNTTHTITIKKTGRGFYSLRHYSDRDTYNGKVLATIDELLDAVQDILEPPTISVAVEAAANGQ